MRFAALTLIYVAASHALVQDIGRAAEMKTPAGLVVVGNTVYVADAGAAQIWVERIDGSGFEVFVADPMFRSPTGLTSDGEDLYVADPGAANVFKINQKSKLVTRILPPNPQIVPSDVLYLTTYDVEDGQIKRHKILVVLDGVQKKIYRLDLEDPNGVLQPWAGTNLEDPTSLSSLNYHVLVTDRTANAVFESRGHAAWSNLQSSSPLPGIFFPHLTRPKSVAAAGGVLYIVDGDQLSALVNGTRLVPLAYRTNPVMQPERVLVDEKKQRLLVSDPGSGTVVEWPLLAPITVEVEAGSDVSTPLAALYLHLWNLGVLPMVTLQLPYHYDTGVCQTIPCVIEHGRNLQPRTNGVIENVLCQANQKACSDGKLGRLEPGEGFLFPWVPFEKFVSVERKTFDGTRTVRKSLVDWIPDQDLRASVTEGYLQTLNPGVSPDLMDSGLKGMELKIPVQRYRYFLSVPRGELFNSQSGLAQIVQRYAGLSVQSIQVSSMSIPARADTANSAVLSMKDLQTDYETALRNMDSENLHYDAAGVPILVAEDRKPECRHPVFFDVNGQRAFLTSECDRAKGPLNGVVNAWIENAENHATCVSTLLGARQLPYGAPIARLTALSSASADTFDIDTTYQNYLRPFVVNFSNGKNDVIAERDWKNRLKSPLNQFVLFIAAAGNEDSLLSDQREYPAALARDYPNLISVGALDQTGKYIWEHVETVDGQEQRTGSNHGSAVEILAPGESVPCAMEMLDDNAVYSEATGTSIATPLVASVGALLMSKGLMPGETKARILATAEPLEREKGDEQEPLAVFGRISAKRALLDPATLHIRFTNQKGQAEEKEGKSISGDSILLYELPDDPIHKEPVRIGDVLSIRQQSKDSMGSWYRLVRFDPSHQRTELNPKVRLSGCFYFSSKENEEEKYLVMFGACVYDPTPNNRPPEDHWILGVNDFVGPRLGPDRFKQAH
jgi:subtilisin family serine protease